MILSVVMKLKPNNNLFVILYVLSLSFSGFSDLAFSKEVQTTKFDEVTDYENLQTVRIPFRVNRNLKKDFVIVTPFGADLEVDGEVIGSIKDVRGQFSKIEVGDFDSQPGHDIRFYKHNTMRWIQEVDLETEEPLDKEYLVAEVNVDHLREQWRDYAEFQRKKKNFRALKQALDLPASIEKIQKVVRWVKVYEDEEKEIALELARPTLEEALNLETLDKKILHDVVFSFTISGQARSNYLIKIPHWSFRPIYNIYQKYVVLEGPDETNLVNAAAWSMSGGQTDEDISEIRSLLLNPSLPDNSKKGLIFSLAYTQHPRAAEIISEYARGPIGDNEYSMMAIPSALLDVLKARKVYWELQIYYAQKVASGEETPMGSWINVYLGYDSTTILNLPSHGQLDLESIDEVIGILEQAEPSDSISRKIDEWKDLKEKIQAKI